jgi:predicted Zn-dependent peptidase
MLGEMLREFDGPFNTSDIYRSLLEYGMDFGFYSKMMSVIREITAGELQELAAKYMRPEDFYVIVAGK